MQGAPHLRYYTRNLGEWDWVVDLRIESFAGLLRSDQSLAGKSRLLGSWLVTRLFGGFRLWTRVEVDEPNRRVLHDTEFRKWGVVWFRGRETMHLLEDGRALHIEGEQFIWPRMAKALPFGPFAGRVLESSTEAEYGFEVFGVPCQFRSQLDGELGVMHFEGEWLRGSFELVPEHVARLAERRASEASSARAP